MVAADAFGKVVEATDDAPNFRELQLKRKRDCSLLMREIGYYLVLQFYNSIDY